jgi:RNase P subunit RPR2
MGKAMKRSMRRDVSVLNDTQSSYCRQCCHPFTWAADVWDTAARTLVAYVSCLIRVSCMLAAFGRAGLSALLPVSVLFRWS